MDSVLLARIGISRLALPIPMAKLQIAHGTARALRDPATARPAGEALVQWVAELELESEILEALAVLVLAPNQTAVSGEAVRAAIRWPSILSDQLISAGFSSKVKVNSWAKAHSGEVHPYFRSVDIETELSKGQICPPILRSRLSRLERFSGRPVLKQWAFEFERLLARVREQSDGHWQYFVEDDRQRGQGQFIGRRGHLARSAFLRTLAVAFDVWDLPEELISYEAMYASPIDFSFVRMAPGNAPPWAAWIHDACPRSQSDINQLVISARSCVHEQSSRRLLHLNVPLGKNEKYQAELEVITTMCTPGPFDTADIFAMHDWLPGQMYLTRAPDGTFEIDSPPSKSYPLTRDKQQAAPALLPAVARYVGYFHSDLVGRMPYFAANYSDEMLRARPRLGGAEFERRGEIVGEFLYWNHRWSPTHDRKLGTHCGVAVLLTTEATSNLLSLQDMELRHYWRATVLSRDAEYGEWKEDSFYGTLPFA